MATASFLENNNYSILDFKPYDLPFESTLKELAAKQAYWTRGAMQVTQAYDNVLGLSPFLEKNKAQLNTFKDQAEKQLKKVINSDLSVIENASQANEIYKPLFDTTNPISSEIMYDDQVFKGYKKNLSEINNFKTKDGGKFYSPTNEKFIHLKYQEYLNSKDDPNASAKDFYNKLSNVKYTPYYNIKDEVSKAIQLCKGNENETESTGISVNEQGFSHSPYITNRITQGATATQMSGCIESYLSSKAQQQLGIDAYVHYNKNYEALANDYNGYINDQVSEYDTLQSNYSEQILRESDPAKKQELKERLNELNNSKREFLANNPMDKDPSYFKDNYEALSTSIYSKNKIKSLGMAFNTYGESTTIRPNEYFQKELEFQNSKKLLDYKHQLEKDLYRFKDKIDNSGKPGVDNPNVSIDFETVKGEDADVVFSEENLLTDLQKVRDNLIGAKGSDLDAMKQSLKDLAEQEGVPSLIKELDQSLNAEDLTGIENVFRKISPIVKANANTPKGKILLRDYNKMLSDVNMYKALLREYNNFKNLRESDLNKKVKTETDKILKEFDSNGERLTSSQAKDKALRKLGLKDTFEEIKTEFKKDDQTYIRTHKNVDIDKVYYVPPGGVIPNKGLVYTRDPAFGSGLFYYNGEVISNSASIFKKAIKLKKAYYKEYNSITTKFADQKLTVDASFLYGKTPKENHPLVGLVDRSVSNYTLTVDDKVKDLKNTTISKITENGELIITLPSYVDADKRKEISEHIENQIAGSTVKPTNDNNSQLIISGVENQVLNSIKSPLVFSELKESEQFLRANYNKLINIAGNTGYYPIGSHITGKGDFLDIEVRMNDLAKKQSESTYKITDTRTGAVNFVSGSDQLYQFIHAAR